MITLLHPQAYSDSEILDALIYFSEGRLNKTPVLTEHYDRGLSLFSRLWRIGSETVFNQNQTLFQHCFGEPISQRWYPLLKAVYYAEQQPKDCDYTLNAVHSYHCRSGRWTEEYYYLSPHKHKTFMGLLHQADSLFRRYLHTGRYLKEKEADQWAVPLIEAAIQADREAVLEASRPKVTIDLSGLDQIRKDALTTQNSLLSEADLQEEERVTEEPKHEEETVMEEEPAVPDLPIDAVHLQILRTLLQGKEVQSLIKAHHLMPALIADTINEVFYDEIGDTILLCEDDILSVVEDYREDVEQIIGGSCQ